MSFTWSQQANRYLIFGIFLSVYTPCGLRAEGPIESEAELRARVKRLSAELEAAQDALRAAEAKRLGTAPESGPSLTQELPSPTTDTSAESAEALMSSTETTGADKITPGDVFPILEGLEIGGAVRVNYYWGDYKDQSPNTSADAAGDGTISLDTFRINMDYTRDDWVAKFEYRFYEGYLNNDSYHFLHTGWIGYNFDNGDQVQVGVNRVPFGPGAYGISQSWFFDQHYYMGLADDMDLGIKYSGTRDALSFDLAYYYSDEGSWSGSTRDSSRYSYDVVDETGDGYEERHQFNARAIYTVDIGEGSVDLGASGQVGQLESQGSQDDGTHYALSVHPVLKWHNWTWASQLTYYHYDIDAYLNGDSDGDLIQLGAYDFPTTAATEAWIAGTSLSYYISVDHIDWLDYVIPYVEYSSIMKAESSFNNSDLFILGAAWARGGWYIYTEWAYSNGNDFVGDESGFDSRFGSNPDDDWESRFNINLGYYF